MRVSTPTGAMADVFDRHEDRLAEFADKFHWAEWQARRTGTGIDILIDRIGLFGYLDCQVKKSRN